MKKKLLCAICSLTFLTGCNWFNQREEANVAEEIEKTIQEIENDMNNGFHHQELPHHTPHLGSGRNETL